MLPLCPLVLGLVASQPRDRGAVARELGRGDVELALTAHGAAAVTLDRLQRAGLVYSRPTGRGGALFRATARGRREPALQRSVWSSIGFRRLADHPHVGG